MPLEGKVGVVLKRHRAALKAWETMRKRERELTPMERESLHRRRVRAAHKAWRTMRAKAA